MFTTDQKGAIAETAIIHAATKLGIEVYRPVQEGGRYDLIFDLWSSLVRVQCKWASRYGDVLIVRCYSCRRAREGMRKRGYTPDEIDAIAAYSIDLDRCYFLPLNEIWRQTIQLRLAPTANNQHLKINWAADYDFAAKLARRHGAVAQLGERLSGRQKGTGSSPVGSTVSPHRLPSPEAEGQPTRRDRSQQSIVVEDPPPVLSHLLDPGQVLDELSEEEIRADKQSSGSQQAQEVVEVERHLRRIPIGEDQVIRSG